jgi:hypothetical protein
MIRQLTTARPQVPAALHLYDDQGRTPVLALDLDTKLAGEMSSTTHAERATVVEQHANEITELLTGLGARVIVDVSPTGGRHVWAPLASPASRGELEPVLRALQARWPTLDTGPALNIAVGCLRPPGAVHPNGGVQQLLTPFRAAVEAVQRRSAPDLLNRLRMRFAPVSAAPVPIRPGGRELVDEHETARPGGRAPLAPMQATIAATGVWPVGRRTTNGTPWTPSEARQSVLASAAARGWSLADVLAQVEQGAWPGLVGLYARYGNAWRTALGRDWRTALDYAARPFTPSQPRNPATAASKSPIPTQGGKPQHGGGRSPRPTANDHRWIRRWHATWTQLGPLTLWTGREQFSIRAVLDGLGWAAQVRGTRYIDVGTRTLALATALLDHSTVAAVLRRLAELPDGPIVRVETGRGASGDLYELVIPDKYVHVWDGRPLPTGRIERVDPVWAHLGLPERAVYQAVCAQPGASAPDLAAAAGVSRSEAYRALATLRTVRLVARTGGLGGWRRTRTRLATVARRLGVAAAVATKHAVYAVERAAWRAVLAGRGWAHRAIVAATTPVHTASLVWPAELPDPPPDDPSDELTALERAIEILIGKLGATVLSTH